MSKISSINAWIKRIFSIQTLSLIVAIIAAYYTYRAYVDSRPAQLSVYLPSLNDNRDDFLYKEAKEVSNIWNLGFYEIPPVSINNAAYGGVDNVLLFPIIRNESRKSVKDLTVDVYIWYDKCMSPFFNPNNLDYYAINCLDYDIVEQTYQNVHLRYKTNVLPSKRIVEYPIKTLMLFMADDSISQQGGLIDMTFSITYEGITKPILFRYCSKMYYRDSFDESFINMARHSFYKEDVFSNLLRNKKYDGEWVIIEQNNVYRNIKHLSDKEFLTFGSFMIDDLQEQ